MPSGGSKWYRLDVARKQAAERVGNPDSFLAIVATNPAESAQRATAGLCQQGYKSTAIHDPDPRLPRGKPAAVLSEVLARKMLVFRQHITKMGAKPPAWHDDVL